MQGQIADSTSGLPNIGGPIELTNVQHSLGAHPRLGQRCVQGILAQFLPTRSASQVSYLSPTP